MPDQIIVAKLSTEKQAALRAYLKQRVRELKDGMKELYEEKIIKWRDAYNAKPLEEIRQFPWQNASNLIVPIVAIHTDTLHAQIMAAVFKTSPLFVAKIMGEQGNDSLEMKDAYEEYMQWAGIEPRELDLYRVYNEGKRECIKYGTVTYKVPWEQQLRYFFTGGAEIESHFLRRIIYEGPRPEKLPFTGFYIPPQAKSIEDADIKAHKMVMQQWQLEERKFADIYDKEAVATVLASPDRTAPTHEQQEKEADLGAKTKPPHKEWDIWECYVTWRYQDEAFAPRMIVTYHEKTDTLLRVAYDNMEFEWFVGARMSSRDDMYHGSGFAEVLWDFQEGASETYNGYRDNQTVANTRVWRVHPDSKLHQGYRIYPSAMLPGDKDEIEALAHGDLSNINIDELRLLLDLAERRSGVSPPMQGMGAGVMTKRGIYSAMGTLALLQEGNGRKDANVSDMRDCHVRIGRLCSHLYGVLGSDSAYHKKRVQLFGAKAQLINKAFEAIVSKKLALPVYSSTASINREVEKQNDMMLSQVMMRHYQTIVQILGGLQQMGTPPAVKQYMIEVIVASNLIMKRMLRNFGYDEVDRLLPDPTKQAQGQPQEPQQPQLPPGQPQQGAPDVTQQNTSPQPPINPVVAGGQGGSIIQ